MELNLKKRDNVTVVYLNGRLDVHFSGEIEKAIHKLIADKSLTHLVFNLRDVEYVSSSGFGLFISLTRIFKENEMKFILCNISTSVQKILDAVQLNSLFQILATEDEAVEYILKAD